VLVLDRELFYIFTVLFSVWTTTTSDQTRRGWLSQSTFIVESGENVYYYSRSRFFVE